MMDTKDKKMQDGDGCKKGKRRQGEELWMDITGKRRQGEDGWKMQEETR